MFCIKTALLFLKYFVSMVITIDVPKLLKLGCRHLFSSFFAPVTNFDIIFSRVPVRIT